MKTYYRPLSLLFGADARAGIAAGEAGALGGMHHIGFTQIEVISRGPAGTKRHIANYGSLRGQETVDAVTAARPKFGPMAMDSTRLMGIVNVTPDSFSDGGKLETTQAAIRHGRKLTEEGADILDVGGESTRPGSDQVSAVDELARVEPVIAGLATQHAVSADTRKAEVMTRALKAGASIINDVSGLNHDPRSASVIANAGAPVIIMHAQGDPKTMQLNPRYDDVVLDVYDALEQRIKAAETAGIARHNICIDPGIGFGKTFLHNLQLLSGLSLFHGLGVPMLVGLSRKAFVGAVTGEKLAAKRVHGSVGGALQAAMMGAHILRVHDVAATRQALSLFTASLDPDSADL
jgi:dihydropteroate synthase